MSPDEIHEFGLLNSRQRIGIPISEDEEVVLAHLRAMLDIEQRRQRLARTAVARAAELAQFVDAPHRHIIRLPVAPSARSDRFIVSMAHIGAPDRAPRGVPYVAAIIKDSARLEYAFAEGSAIGFLDESLWREIQDGITQSARASAFFSVGNDVASFYEAFSANPKAPPGYAQFVQFLGDLVRHSPAATLPLYASFYRSIAKSGSMFADRHATALYEACKGRSPSIDLQAIEPWEPKAKRTPETTNAVKER